MRRWHLPGSLEMPRRCALFALVVVFVGCASAPPAAEEWAAEVCAASTAANEDFDAMRAAMLREVETLTSRSESVRLMHESALEGAAVARNAAARFEAIEAITGTTEFQRAWAADFIEIAEAFDAMALLGTSASDREIAAAIADFDGAIGSSGRSRIHAYAEIPSEASSAMRANPDCISWLVLP